MQKWVRRLNFRISIGILGFCLASLVYAQEFVDGERYMDTGKAAAAQTKALKQVNQKTDISLRITLSPVMPAEKAALAARKDQPLKIGFGRDIPPPYDKNLEPLITWTAHPEGGNTAAFTVTSPGARAMRLALVVPRVEQGVEVRFFNAGLGQVLGPFTAKDISSPSQQKARGSMSANKVSAKPDGEEFIFWSPVIEGETIGVEIYLPASVDPGGFSISIPQVSHLVHSMSYTSKKSLSDIGSSGSCNIDLACRSTVPGDLGDAVAKIIYTEDGFSFLCTGTLLVDNERDSFIDYFITAHHCINSQAAARTVNTYWFFERSRCSGPKPTSVIQRTRGAELVSTGANSDFTFLQLNDNAPVGVLYAGWNAGSLAASSTVIGIHHPSGDLKKWSRGRNTGFADFGGNVNGRGSHLRVIWSQGITEGGSSGSGVFDAAGRFRGNLEGGDSSCSARNQPDWYGRFDLTYPSVKRWLYLHPVTLSSGVAVNASVKKGDSREYKIVTTGAHTRLTVSLSNLSRDADLYVRRGDRPTLTTYHCRPFRRGAAAETCALSNSGMRTYYIRVRGYSGTTAFRIRATLT